MKSSKKTGERLVSYIQDGIVWKEHKDIVLDFWIRFKSPSYKYDPKQFQGLHYTDELPENAQKAYEHWFGNYDFQNNVDKDWIQFVDGTLNLFYHTANPTIIEDNTWFCVLLPTEDAAKEICETQIFHGSPNLNSFFKVSSDTKSDEIGGRRNGYVYATELAKVTAGDMVGFPWAVAFQSDDSVKLFFQNGSKVDSKCICWASECRHATLLKNNGKGQFFVVPVTVPERGWRRARDIPMNMSPAKPLTPLALNQYFIQNFHEMYGVMDEIDEKVKYLRGSINERKSAITAMNDENVQIDDVLPDVRSFILNGNVSIREKEFNKLRRKMSKQHNRERETEIKARIREIQKEDRKKTRRERQRLNPFAQT
jgi:hypothetical protein